MTTEVNGARIEIVRDYDEMSATAARRIMDRLVQHPSSNLLVPTGTSPIGTFAILRQESPDRFAGVTMFNFDEYCVPGESGEMELLYPGDPRSYRYFMRKHILASQPRIRSIFPGLENIAQPGQYDKFIATQGGIDLSLNAIGEDAHTFGFNLPGGSFDSVTRLVELNDTTKKVNAGLTGHDIPSHAVTTGIMTGMQSQEVIMLVSGARKAAILRQIIEGDITPDVPASIVRTHPNATWIVDEAAASQLAV